MHLRKILIHCGFKVSEPGQCCWGVGLSDLGFPGVHFGKTVNPILTRAAGGGRSYSPN